MADEFASAASRLAGLTTLNLGWRPGEFWAATPAELGAILACLPGAEGGPVTARQLDRLKEQFPDG